DLSLFIRGLLLALHGGRSLDTLWVLPFLRAMQTAWTATESAMGMPVTSDFILPVLTNLGGLSRPCSIYAKPMAYSQGLAAMRHFLTIPWQDSTKPVPVTPEESRAFTLHGLKVCLLAAGAQVRATEEARQHQGHHKSPSVQLYSRDNTFHPFGEGVSRFVYSREADIAYNLPDSPEPAQALLVEKFASQDHGVHEVLAQALALKGLESVDDFAYAFPEIRSLESLLSGSARPSDLPTIYAKPTQQVQQSPSLPAAILPQASPASWVENLP
ncbi:unnamed protein product, partial [Symbiodinium microadriaticum]